MGDLRPFPPARPSPVPGMGYLYQYSFPQPLGWVWAICARCAVCLGSISMSIYGGDPMAARSALPFSGRVWEICAYFPRHWCPAGPSAPHGAPMPSESLYFTYFPHFACEFPFFAQFTLFSLIFARSGRLRWRWRCGVKSLQFFYSLRRRAGERRGGALKVIAYTLYAMSNSPPCVMPSGMALLLRPARFARSRWEKTCVHSSCSSASDNFSLCFFGLSAFAPVLVRIFG